MHMSDALITPIVGGTMLVTSGGTIKYSINKLKMDVFEKRLPLMAVMGAFLFAAQMINFAIPGTGSSGHIGGGMLLAVILGPSAGFLTMACVLIIQALFFADGGLLAYGCNLMNLGFFTCYVAYPLVYKPLVGHYVNSKKIMIATITASVVGLQLGSIGVVFETFLSGRTQLTLGTFILFMQPIHLAIGIIEGIITGIIIHYLYVQNKDMLYENSMEEKNNKMHKKSIIIIVVATLVLGGIVSLFASENPDGLEWAVFKTAKTEEVANESQMVQNIEKVQQKIALLPDYGFEEEGSSAVGTSISGIGGSLITLFITFLIGIMLRRKPKREDIYE